MKNPYPNEKFSNAVRSMAISPGSIQERIGDAYVYNLMHIKTEEVPEEIQEQFENVKRRLTCVEPASDEGRVAATVRQMSTDEAIEIAKQILHMAHVVRRDLYDN